MHTSIAGRCSSATCCSSSTQRRESCQPVRPSKVSKRCIVGAASQGDSGSWGEQMRPDTCNLDDQDRPGPPSSLDMEWQEFIAGKGRFTQPKPLLWDQDDLCSSSRPPSCSSNGDSDLPSTSDHGLSTSNSNRYSSSIQSFDEWDLDGDAFALPVPYSMPVNEALPLSSSTSSNAAAAAAAPGAAASIHSLAGVDGMWGASLQPSRDLVSPADVLGSRGVWQDMREVYVLLFGVGQKDTEGIYSLRAVSEDGLPTETIIAFENMDDAERYSALLEATMEHRPHVCSIPPAELMAFCSDSGYRCRLELEGSLLMPPEYNVHVTDWERSLRLREGKFHVLQEEPDVTAADAADNSMTFLGMSGSLQMGMYLPSMAGYSLSRDSPFNQQPGDLSACELDVLKAQLEALLPPTPPTDGSDMMDC